MSTAASSSNQASFLFDIPDTDLDFLVLSFEAIETISSPFEVNITLGCGDLVAFEQVAGRGALLTIFTQDVTANGGKRYFHGEIAKFKLIGESGDCYLYSARLVPSMWRLSLEQDCRIFQNSTLQSIVETVLQESGITSDQYKFLLKEEDLKSKYCVQYNESDLNFISRLLEEEGIFYFFEHYEDKHVVIFCDFTFFCVEVPGVSLIPYNTSDGMVSESESITAFNLSERLCPDVVTTKSFNYKRPGFDLTAEEAGTDGRAEVFEFAGTFASEKRGKKLAKIRLEEHSSLEKKAKGESNCPRFTPGFTFTLEGSPSENCGGNFLLLAVEHVGDQPQSLDELGSGSAEYWNGFICVPASVNLRPSRITPKPVIPGMQTAIVTGPPGEEIHHDNFGRVKVQFHWDRQGARNDKSSCWLRYAQGWGGGGWGMQFIPRVGDEVLVAFLDGDPDRPVIVGSLYNSANMPLYNPVDSKTVSTIRTRSYPNGGIDNFHELRFDDQKGEEEIYLRSEKDWTILVKNDKAQQVVRDESLQVGNNRLKRVGADQTELVGRNHSETIGANKNESVAINSTESVGLAKELSIGGAYQVSVGGAMNETVLGAKAEEVGVSKSVLVGAHLAEKVVGNRSMTVEEDFSTTVSQTCSLKAKSIVIEADDEIVFRSGRAQIKIDNSGNIVISGGTVLIESSGEVVIKGDRVSLN